MFIYCKETNDYVCATSLLDEENSAEQFSYTPHFLRRYAERALGIENMPINRVLAHIEREVGYTVLIYKNDTSKVIATSMGLYLQRLTKGEVSIYARLLLVLTCLKPPKLKRIWLLRT